jgi:transcriptional regulator with XRE-family HTH domain
MAKVRTNPKTKQRTFIRQWRKHKGLTLSQVAEELHVTAGTLSQLERGTVNYTQPMLEALADLFGCEPADLLIRDPSAPEAIWSIWEEASPAERAQIVELSKVLLRRAG